MRTATSRDKRRARRHRALAGVEETKQAHLLAELLAPWLPNLGVKGPGLALGWAPENDDFSALVEFQLQRLWDGSPEVREAVEKATSTAGSGERPKAHTTVIEALEQALLERDAARRSLWTVIEEAGGPPEQGEPDANGSTPDATRGDWLRRAVSGGVLLLISAVVVAGALIFSDDYEVLLLKCFAIVVLSCLPGWLFLRFIVFRAGTIWTEYVLNLHRLGFDEHQNLPEPPASSGYYRLWYEGGGALLRGTPSIYRQKFETYYGKTIARLSSGSERALLTDRTLVPVFLSTAVFACGWATVLWRDSIFTPRDPMLLIDALRFGFLGAYSFILQMLIRRYFQSDLKASAYLSALTRVATVLIMVTVLFWVGLYPTDLSTGWQAGLAFFIGFFPLVGMQLLQRGLSTRLRRWLPTLDNPYPLSDLVGLNVWYEARLLEEGIEDMENLVTANLVDVLLHTRVPVGRLVDWIDQAHLYLALDPPRSKQELKALDKAETKVLEKIANLECPPDALEPYRRARRDQRQELRQLGVRTATDFESLFRNPQDLKDRARSRAVLAVNEATFTRKLCTILNDDRDDRPNVAEAILKVFCNSPALIHVRHWRDVLLAEHHQHGPVVDAQSNGHATTGAAR